MSAVSVVISGVDQLRARVDAHLKRVTQKQLDALRIGAVMIHRDAVVSIQKGPKTGHLYGNHRASAPGQAPAADTGNLARNIGFEIDKRAKTAEIASRAPYSMALEFGTNDGLIKERPFMTPAYLKNLPAIQDLFAAAANG